MRYLLLTRGPQRARFLAHWGGPPLIGQIGLGNRGCNLTFAFFAATYPYKIIQVQVRDVVHENLND